MKRDAVNADFFEVKPVVLLAGKCENAQSALGNLLPQVVPLAREDFDIDYLVLRIERDKFGIDSGRPGPCRENGCCTEEYCEDRGFHAPPLRRLGR